MTEIWITTWAIVGAFLIWVAVLSARKRLQARPWAWIVMIALTLFSHVSAAIWLVVYPRVIGEMGPGYDFAPWFDDRLSAIGTIGAQLWAVGTAICVWRKPLRFASRRLAWLVAGGFVVLMTVLNAVDLLSYVATHFAQPQQVAEAVSPDGKATMYLMEQGWLEPSFEFRQPVRHHALIAKVVAEGGSGALGKGGQPRMAWSADSQIVAAWMGLQAVLFLNLKDGSAYSPTQLPTMKSGQTFEQFVADQLAAHGGAAK